LQLRFFGVTLQLNIEPMELKVNSDVVKIAGSPAAVMLAYIKKLKKDAQGHIFLSEEDVVSDLCISNKTQLASLKKLNKYGFVSEVGRKGYPAKRYVTIQDTKK
jgi:hypothetical protein